MSTPQNADRDLGSQQHQLATMQYDLRITNLARFLFSKIRNAYSLIPYSNNVLPSKVEGSLHDGRDDNGTYEVSFATQWNVVGFFVYAFYEKVLHKSINEKMRYSNSLPSRFIRFVLDSILKLEEAIGGVPLGLTQVVGVRKK